MANTGHITSSGIVQIFTTGPYSGSEVTSSYSDGSFLFGPIINTNQSFISGTIDNITPCEITSNPINGINTFERFYFDPTVCPPDNICLPPTLLSATRNTPCLNNNSTHSISYFSGSSTADYTIIEYSTSPSFIITGSTILDNSTSTSPASINVLINGFSPSIDNPVYFRAYNSCSNDTISGYSSTVIANNCVPTQPTYQNFTFNIVNETSFTVQTTDGNGNGNSGPWIYVPQNNTTGNLYTFNIENRNFFFKVAAPSNCPNQGIFVELTTTTSDINGNVSTNIISILDPTDCNGPGMGFQTTQYPSNPGFLHYPTTNLNTQLATTISINRTNWINQGNIKLTIKHQQPSGPNNPSLEFGVGIEP